MRRAASLATTFPNGGVHFERVERGGGGGGEGIRRRDALARVRDGTARGERSWPQSRRMVLVTLREGPGESLVSREFSARARYASRL